MEHARATREEERENNVSNFPFVPPNPPSPAWQAFEREGEGKRRETTSEGGGRTEEGNFHSFLPRAPKLPLHLLTPATQAKPARVPLQRSLFWRLNY